MLRGESCDEWARVVQDAAVGDTHGAVRIETVRADQRLAPSGIQPLVHGSDGHGGLSHATIATSQAEVSLK